MGVKLIIYGIVMGGLFLEKFLDVNVFILFVGLFLDIFFFNKYKWMVDVWGGWKLF